MSSIKSKPIRSVASSGKLGKSNGPTSPNSSKHSSLKLKTSDRNLLHVPFSSSSSPSASASAGVFSQTIINAARSPRWGLGLLTPEVVKGNKGRWGSVSRVLTKQVAGRVFVVIFLFTLVGTLHAQGLLSTTGNVSRLPSTHDIQQGGLRVRNSESFEHSNSNYYNSNNINDNNKNKNNNNNNNNAARLPPTSHNRKTVTVALLADCTLHESTRRVLQMIKQEGVDMVIHAGDIDYNGDASLWEAQLDDILGPDFAYFFTQGNYENKPKFKKAASATTADSINHFTSERKTSTFTNPGGENVELDHNLDVELDKDLDVSTIDEHAKEEQEFIYMANRDGGRATGISNKFEDGLTHSLNDNPGVLANGETDPWLRYVVRRNARLKRLGARCVFESSHGDIACNLYGFSFLLSTMTVHQERAGEDLAFVQQALTRLQLLDETEHVRPTWTVCAWHAPLQDTQLGFRPGVPVMWSKELTEAYNSCRRHGAIIVSGHEHYYVRTHTVTDFTHPIQYQVHPNAKTIETTKSNTYLDGNMVSSAATATSDAKSAYGPAPSGFTHRRSAIESLVSKADESLDPVVYVSPGKTIAVVSGLGGHSVSVPSLTQFQARPQIARVHPEKMLTPTDPMGKFFYGHFTGTPPTHAKVMQKQVGPEGYPFGALICTFEVEGTDGQCYFKTIDGKVVDRFIVRRSFV